jgi:hypothetical protein
MVISCGEINGLPLQSGVIGATNEVAFSDTLKILKGDNRGWIARIFPLLSTLIRNGPYSSHSQKPPLPSGVMPSDKGEINGLPLQSGVIGATNEVAFSDTLKILKGDNFRILRVSLNATSLVAPITPLCSGRPLISPLSSCKF